MDLVEIVFSFVRDSSVEGSEVLVIVVLLRFVLGDFAGSATSLSCAFVSERSRFEGGHLANTALEGESFGAKGSDGGVVDGEVFVATGVDIGGGGGGGGVDGVTVVATEESSDGFEASAKLNLFFARAALAFESVSLALDNVSFRFVGDAGSFLVEDGSDPIFAGCVLVF